MAKEHKKFGKTRVESDAFGPLKIPADRLWGAQTQRSLHNFRIGTERMPIEIVRATRFVPVSMRVSVPEYWFATHSERRIAVSAAGPLPTAIVTTTTPVCGSEERRVGKEL